MIYNSVDIQYLKFVFPVHCPSLACSPRLPPKRVYLYRLRLQWHVLVLLVSTITRENDIEEVAILTNEAEA